MSNDWDDPAEPDFFVIKDHVGSLVIIAVNEFFEKMSTSMGERDTIKAEIAVVDGPGKDKRFPDGLLFGAKIVPQLRAKLGGAPVLGTIGRGTAKAGQSAPYILIPASDEDKAKASNWVKAHGSVTHTSPTTKDEPKVPVSAGRAVPRYDEDEAPF